jgi:hypothetical protein
VAELDHRGEVSSFAETDAGASEQGGKSTEKKRQHAKRHQRRHHDAASPQLAASGNGAGSRRKSGRKQRHRAAAAAGGEEEGGSTHPPAQLRDQVPGATEGGDSDGGTGVEWYIKLFLGAHFADNLAWVIGGFQA